jgi:hypothetical protein
MEYKWSNPAKKADPKVREKERQRICNVRNVISFLSEQEEMCLSGKKEKKRRRCLRRSKMQQQRQQQQQGALFKYGKRA